MKLIKIEATKYSPKVELSPEGKMTIYGRSIMEDPIEFYNQIINWVKNCQSKTFALDVQLEYMNTSSSKVLLDLLKSIKERYNMNEVFINWYYESDDEDMLDIGKDFESLVCIPFDFYELCKEEA